MQGHISTNRQSKENIHRFHARTWLLFQAFPFSPASHQGNLRTNSNVIEYSCKKGLAMVICESCENAAERSGHSSQKIVRNAMLQCAGCRLPNQCLVLPVEIVAEKTQMLGVGSRHDFRDPRFKQINARCKCKISFLRSLVCRKKNPVPAHNSVLRLLLSI